MSLTVAARFAAAARTARFGSRSRARGPDRPPARTARMRRAGRIGVVCAAALAAAGCIEGFDLSVAAFEIGPHDAILWTHVVPSDPGRRTIALGLEVATDAAFTDVVRRRAVVARRDDDFTVRAQLRGLRAGRDYYYRFVDHRAGGDIRSPVGHFRTAPLPNEDALARFVISGDSNIGFTTPLGLDFHVLSAAAQEDPDFFVYFGDTIYADSGVLPGGADAFTLDEYRTVHKLTRADPHLQTLLASAGTFTGWDDHEVRNDYDGETVDPVQFANGARAFSEYLPVRRSTRPPYRIDRRVRWGKHIEMFFLDGRQFRSAEQFCNPDPIPDGPQTPQTLFSPFVEDEVLLGQINPLLAQLAAPLLVPSDPDCVANVLAAPGRTILGAEQKAALLHALRHSDATFKVIINDVPISSLFAQPYDRWEGYLAERQELLDAIAQDLDPSRTLVLTTDFHTNLALRRPELTEVVVGPIGQTTFGLTVEQLLPPELQPFLPFVFPALDAQYDLGNGGPGALLGAEPDAFSYAVVELVRDGGSGEPRLRVTVRGNPDWRAGANDPADVRDLFTLELPN